MGMGMREGGNHTEGTVSGRQRLRIDRGGHDDVGEEAGKGKNDTEAPLSGSFERKE
jgi:hypothetical protein